MKLTLRPAVTLDGFIADLKGNCYSWINPEDEKRYELELLLCGYELVGRKTYEQYKENYDARTKVLTFVYTTKQLQDTEMIKFVNGKPEDVLRTIEQTYGIHEIITSGGGQMNGLLLTSDVVDELYISYHSIILGEGIKMFGIYKPFLKLELLDVNTEIEGVVRNHYRVLKELH